MAIQIISLILLEQVFGRQRATLINDKDRVFYAKTLSLPGNPIR